MPDLWSETVSIIQGLVQEFDNVSCWILLYDTSLNAQYQVLCCAIRWPLSEHFLLGLPDLWSGTVFCLQGFVQGFDNGSYWILLCDTSQSTEFRFSCCEISWSFSEHFFLGTCDLWSETVFSPQGLVQEFDNDSHWILLYNTSLNTLYQLPCCGIGRRCQ
jgi:hypothetical protein